MLVSIEANQRTFAKQMQAVAKQSADAAKYIEDNFKRANDNVASGFQRGGRQVTASMRQSSAAVSNLSFQLNDIAMQLASGTSPFTVMVQQGSQVAQVFNGTGGGLIGAVRTLGGAFTQMLNPVSLASYALIGLTGYAIQYLTTLGEDVPDTNKLLQEHANIIKSFDEAYGVAAEGAREYSEAAKQLQLQKLKDEFGTLRDAARAAADGIARDILSLSVDAFEGATKTVADFDAALRLLEQDTPDFQQFALDMAKIEQQTGAPENIRELARQFRLSAQESVGLQDAIDKTQSRLNVLRITGGDAKAAFENLTSIALGFGTAGSDAVSRVVDKLRNELIPAAVDAVGKLGEFAKNYWNALAVAG